MPKRNIPLGADRSSPIEPDAPSTGRRGNGHARPRAPVGMIVWIALALLLPGSLALPLHPGAPRVVNGPLGPGALPPSAESSAGSLARPNDVRPAAGPLSAFGWENATLPPGAPVLRYPMIVYDAADGYLLLGGESYSDRSAWYPETWTYANGTWTNITATQGNPPDYRYDWEFTVPVYDAQHHYVLVWSGNGGSVFASGKWTQIALPSSAPDPSIGSVAYDSTDGYVVGVNNFAACESFGVATTYRYTGGNVSSQMGNWSALNAGPSPCLVNSVMSDDPALGGVIEYGGSNATTAAASKETWLYAHGTWTDLTQQATTAAPWVAADSNTPTETMAYDAAAKVVLLVSVTNSGALVTSTWAFNGTWTDVTTHFVPPTLGYGLIAWDPSIPAMVLTEGTQYAPWTRQTIGLSNQTWLYTDNLSLEVAAPSVRPAATEIGVPDAFAAVFQGGKAPYNYTWSFGDGSGSFLAAPSHAYTKAGLYTVTIALRDGAGASANGSVALNVSGALSAKASASPDPTDAGVGSTFAVAVTGGSGPFAYAWEFGDGGSATSPVSGHAYAKSANYTASVWVNDSAGGSTRSNVSLRVNPPLGGNFTMTPSAPDLGQLVNFTASITGGTQPYTLSWAFGDGGTGGNLTNISHVFTTNGHFAATMRIVDAIGAVKVVSQNVTVALNLTVFGSLALGAAPLPVAFTSHVQGGTPSYSFAWRFGDGGTSTLADPSHTYTQPGYYTASVTLTDSVGNVAQADWPLFVGVGSGPLEVQLVSDPPTLSQGGTAVVTATISGGTGGYSLSWNASTRLTCAPSGLLAERCVAGAPGAYTVGVTVVDQSGTRASDQASLSASGLVGGTRPGLATAPPIPWPWVFGGGAALLAIGGLGGFLVARSRGGESSTLPWRASGWVPAREEGAAPSRGLASSERAPSPRPTARSAAEIDEREEISDLL